MEPAPHAFGPDIGQFAASVDYACQYPGIDILAHLGRDNALAVLQNGIHMAFDLVNVYGPDRFGCVLAFAGIGVARLGPGFQDAVPVRVTLEYVAAPAAFAGRSQITRVLFRSASPGEQIVIVRISDLLKYGL